MGHGAGRSFCRPSGGAAGLSGAPQRNVVIEDSSEAMMMTWFGPLNRGTRVRGYGPRRRGWRRPISSIAVVALAPGWMVPSRAVDALIAAVVTGLVCSLLLRGGFWLLGEVMALGRSWLERIVHGVLVALPACFMLPRLSSRVQKSNAYRHETRFRMGGHHEAAWSSNRVGADEAGGGRRRSRLSRDGVFEQTARRRRNAAASFCG
jgi:hypothetical protein